MATAINAGDEVFLDTSYALALSAPTDQFHDEHFKQCGFIALLREDDG
jgi:hypothetical protein